MNICANTQNVCQDEPSPATGTAVVGTAVVGVLLLVLLLALLLALLLETIGW